jgi:hypothetical protein
VYGPSKILTSLLEIYSVEITSLGESTLGLLGLFTSVKSVESLLATIIQTLTRKCYLRLVREPLFSRPLGAEVDCLHKKQRLSLVKDAISGLVWLTV